MTIQARRLRSSFLVGQSAENRSAFFEPQVFIRLFDEYYPRIYNYARFRCGDGPSADDLTAQVFERAYIRFDEYDPQRGPFGAWLFVIARSLISNHLRAESRRPSVSIEVCDSRADASAGPEEQVIHGENTSELLQALTRLSERERDLLSLKFASGLTNRRIAEIVGLSESNVGVILFRTLHRLRAVLAQDLPEA